MFWMAASGLSVGGAPWHASMIMSYWPMSEVLAQSEEAAAVPAPAVAPLVVLPW